MKTKYESIIEEIDKLAETKEEENFDSIDKKICHEIWENNS